MKRIIYLSAIALLIFAIVGCKEKEDNNLDIIQDIEIDNRFLLDSIISNKNPLIPINIQDSATIFLINNQEDLEKISNTNVDVNFDKITIIAGVIRTHSISDKIDDVILYKYDTIFNLEISILWATNSWTEIGNLYFWRAYPKMDINNISLTIKHKKS